MISPINNTLNDYNLTKGNQEYKWLSNRTKRIFDRIPLIRESQPATGEINFQTSNTTLSMAGVTITIGSTVYTYGVDFLGRDALEMAAWFAAAVNGDYHRTIRGEASKPIKDHIAFPYGAKVVIISTIGGPVGNSISLATSNSTEINIPASNLSGGSGGAYDFLTGSLNITDIAPALMHREGLNTLLNAVTATGTSYAVSGGATHNHTFIKIATNITTGLTLLIEGSLDNTNWVTLDTDVINANGQTQFSLSDIAWKYLRANLSARTDGTLTVQHYAGN